MHKRFVLTTITIMILAVTGCQSAGFHEIFDLNQGLSSISFDLADQQGFELSVKLKYDFNITSTTQAIEVYLLSPSGQKYNDRIRLNKKSGLAGTKEKIIQIREVGGESGTWTLTLDPAPAGFTYRQAIVDVFFKNG